MSQSQPTHQPVDPTVVCRRPNALLSGVRRVRTALSTPAARIVAVPLAVALAAGGVAATSATFNDEAKLGVDVAAGTLDINVDGQEGNPTPVAVELPLSRFKPGDSTTKTLEIRNAGTLSAAVRIEMEGQGPTALGEQLDATLSVTPPGFPGALSINGKANYTSLEPFTLPAGERAPLTLTLTLPADTDDTWQGKTDTLTLTLTAVQE